MRFGIAIFMPALFAGCFAPEPCRAAHSWLFGSDLPVSGSAASASIASLGQHNVLVRGSRVFVLWEERRDGDPAVHFARSLDGGTTFEPEVRVSDGGPAELFALTADASGDRVFVLWRYGSSGPAGAGLYLDRSSDGGATFGVDRYLQAGCAGSYPDRAAAMATDGADRLLLAWVAGDSVLVMRSLDAGETFDCPARVDAYPPHSPWDCCPAVAGARAHVLHSGGGAESFTRGTPGGCGETSSFAVSEEGTVHGAWMRAWPTQGFVRPSYSRSVDRGASWESRDMEPMSDGVALPVSVDARGPTVGMVWLRASPEPQLVFAGSRDGGATWGPVQGVADEPGAGPPSVALGEQGDACVVWTRDGRVYFDRGVFTQTTAVEAGAFAPGDTPGLRVAPNPSRQGFEIGFSRAGDPFGDREPRIEVLDARGRRIRTLPAVGDPAGGEAFWDGLDETGAPVPGGIYFVRARSGGRALSARVVVSR